jgi:quinol monooxygenase YgiN
VTDQVAVVAKLTAAEGKSDELRQVIAELVESVRQTEPDTVIYAAAQDNDDPGVFWFYEFYGSPEAAQAHAAGEALAEASQRMRGLLAGRPEIHRLTPIADKGVSR